MLFKKDSLISITWSSQRFQPQPGYQLVKILQSFLQCDPARRKRLDFSVCQKSRKQRELGCTKPCSHVGTSLTIGLLKEEAHLALITYIHFNIHGNWARLRYTFGFVWFLSVRLTVYLAFDT